MIMFYRVGAIILFGLMMLLILAPTSWFGTETNRYIIYAIGFIIGWLFTGIADILQKLERIAS